MNLRHRNRTPSPGVMRSTRERTVSREHVNAHGRPKHRFTRRGALEFTSRRPNLRPYRCSVCGSWHVTHLPKGTS